jgi:hypothetical protein
MKALIAGIVLILVIGIAGFMYRNVLERPTLGGAVAPAGSACTLEAKLCPDGSSVGRTGPDCSFAACALPNAEDAAIGIAFVVPAGYAANPDAIGADETLRAVFDKPSKGPVPHSIVIRDYPIKAGETAEEVMLAHTMYESSGNMAESIDELKPVAIAGRTYRVVTLERFEGQVHTVYYLARAHDVLRFEVLEKDVDWTNPDLVVRSLPEHKALEALLGKLQLSVQ